ncbi:hypothetical protein B0H66DRAFT_283038 [Apodospora peruviana]|uniref:Secreted protein n=1 Tax=Apodospora peruviana TaxID=516989 RepID=A0AAE0I089_9PEZI|nr:hypothetical protein B0H66DRAFT_283038 [Apodospora peruviana]
MFCIGAAVRVLSIPAAAGACFDQSHVSRPHHEGHKQTKHLIGTSNGLDECHDYLYPLPARLSKKAAASISPLLIVDIWMCGTCSCTPTICFIYHVQAVSPSDDPAIRFLSPFARPNKPSEISIHGWSSPTDRRARTAPLNILPPAPSRVWAIIPLLHSLSSTHSHLALFIGLVYLTPSLHNLRLPSTSKSTSCPGLELEP